MDGPSIRAPRRKRAKTNHNNDDGTNRKRIQNRISQRCLRERQQAHSRQAETYIDLMSSIAREGDDDESRNQPMFNAHMNLLDENRRLYDALFRMKKKLLSLSNMAAMAAADPIFNQLSSATDKKCQEGGDSRPEIDDDTLEDSDPFPPLFFPTEASRTENSTDSVNIPAPISSYDLGIVPYYPDTSLLPSSKGQRGVLPTRLAVDPRSGLSLAQGSLLPEVNGSPKLLFQVPYGFCVDRISCCVRLNLVDRLIKVSMAYMLRALGEDGAYRNQGLTSSAASTAAKPRSAYLLGKLSQVSTHVLACLGGQESYLYQTGVHAPMETIFRWRLSRLPEDRLAIPQPYQPTPLQCISPCHPIAIDFVTWPSIRDQLILQAQGYNLDTIIYDLALNTVIDFPSLNLSVNIYDLFCNKVLPCSVFFESGTIGQDPMPPNHFFQAVAELPMTDAVDQMLLREVSQRMQFGLYDQGGPGNFTVRDCSSPRDFASTGPRYMRPQRSDLAIQYGLNRQERWKLSPAFARKYPDMNCTSEVSAFEMVSCTEVLGL
ncbi:hypothetical protein B0O99DRAFT_638169 [Bisporella sp. PMI_857]|nr:hypothetical protein B0O99DRAFT_638169 [Bisporella sp. PMI_857]